MNFPQLWGVRTTVVVVCAGEEVAAPPMCMPPPALHCGSAVWCGTLWWPRMSPIVMPLPGHALQAPASAVVVMCSSAPAPAHTTMIDAARGMSADAANHVGSTTRCPARVSGGGPRARGRTSSCVGAALRHHTGVCAPAVVWRARIVLAAHKWWVVPLCRARRAVVTSMGRVRWRHPMLAADSV